MQFQHPEFLYLLFLLIIPIIVHLFQLRKFQKTPFTNVAFLKKVVLQTRKSSQLKKWLTLLARLFALACIILAFAQPFFPLGKEALQPKETVIYVDNSFSMQLKGKRGELLKRTVQEVLESVPPAKRFTLITNENLYKNTTITELKEDLIQLDYSEASPSLNTILVRAKNEFSQNPNTQKTFVGISDFQENSVEFEAIPDTDISVKLVQLSPVNTENISIDSVFISDESMGKSTLSILVSHTGNTTKNVPVALYNGNELLAKTTANLKEEKQSTEVNLTLTNTSTAFRGKITVEDQGLQYDNTFYFSIGEPEKIKVVALGENSTQNQFLKRIYDDETFEFLPFEKGTWDYNKIATANTVILNELQEIPAALLPILSQVVGNNGHLLLIPPSGKMGNSYETLSLRLNAPRYSERQEKEKKITKISFAHPLYQEVFEDQVENFQYPTVQSSWHLDGNYQSILQFSDGRPFLAQAENIYLFTGSLASENSNFKNSPLIVPTFYNVAKQSLKLPGLYSTIGKKTVQSVNVALGKDEILSIENDDLSFIPAQQSTGKHVEITTETRPGTAGIYNITKNDQILRSVAYNYDRKESRLTYVNLAQLEQIEVAKNVETFFSQQNEKNEIDGLWKWFVIFAVFFLLTELLFLKYLK